jgi:monovalent cation/hydrogen antiporter
MLAFTAHDELQLWALLAALGAMLVAAAAQRLPPAILLVLGGLVLGFIPGVPQLALPPDLVLVAILPPLLYSAAFFTGLRDLRANLRPITLLAVGAVALTGSRTPRFTAFRGASPSRSARSSLRPTRWRRARS